MLKNIAATILVLTTILMISVNTVYTGNLVDRTFKTIPDNLPWYPVVVFGDNRPSDTSRVELPSVYYRIVREFRVLKPFAVIGTGDHTGRGTREQINEFISSLEGLENVWVCLGNHDLYSGNIGYWIENVAPEFYYVDDIPGWRIVFVNALTDPLDRFINETMALFKGISNRRAILVIHYPLYPDVKHNIVELNNGVEKMKSLINIINEYNVSLVLQGHWHGYAEVRINNTRYIITGGAGAPLYWSPMNIDAERVVKGKYHYLLLTLFPNGTYVYTPVDAVKGEIKIIVVNETTYLIKNTKVDLWGKPIEVPVRLSITLDNQVHYIVLMAKPNTTTLVSYRWRNNTPTLATNTDKFYIYIPTNDPEKPIVYTMDNTTIIKIKKIPGEQRDQLEENETIITETIVETKAATTVLTKEDKTSTQTTKTISTPPTPLIQEQASNTSTLYKSSKNATASNTTKAPIVKDMYDEQYIFAITVILLITAFTLYYVRKAKR